jgi:hypothetical protein
MHELSTNTRTCQLSRPWRPGTVCAHTPICHLRSLLSTHRSFSGILVKFYDRIPGMPALRLSQSERSTASDRLTGDYQLFLAMCGLA